VGEFWVDPRHHQISGFACEVGPVGLVRRAFNWTQIESIGAQGLVLSTVDGLEVRKPDTAQRVLGDEVWTDGGNKVGQVQDFCLDAETGAIVCYLFTSDAWGGLATGTYMLPPGAVISMGDRRLMVSQSAAEAAELFAGNIQELTRSFFQADLERTRQDVSSMMQGTQAIANRLFHKTQQAVDQRRSALSEHVSQLKVGLNDWSDEAKAKLSSKVQSPTDQPTTSLDVPASRVPDAPADALPDAPPELAAAEAATASPAIPAAAVAPLELANPAIADSAAADPMASAPLPELTLQEPRAAEPDPIPSDPADDAPQQAERREF
jgi:uncharacterized protein YrrD